MMPEEKGSKAMFGVLDITLIVAALAFLAWFIYRRRKTKAETESKANSSSLKIKVIPQRQASVYATLVDKLRAGGKNVVVFYGSQTGTAEEFAGRLAKESMRYGMKGMPIDPEDCEMDDIPKLAELENNLAIFVMATYGEGDPTDNAQELYEWLQAGDSELSNLNYAVFGLGNKTYEHYNEMGTYMDKRLEELGATRIAELGLGDDDANIEEDFLAWKEKFWPQVCEHFGVESIGDDVSMRQFTLTIHNTQDLDRERVFTGEAARLHSYQNQRPPYDAKNPFMATITTNKELHNPQSSRSCMHIELDITGSKIRYESGDHVAIYPSNNSVLVDRLGELLSVDLDTIITLTNVDEDASKKHPFPCPCSYRTALSHYLDITSLPRTHVLKELSEYTSNEEDKAKLVSMATPEGKDVYSSWVIKECRNIVEILEDMPSVKPPLDHLCELLPRLQARYYSISSSPKVHPNSIHVTAILVDYTSPTGRSHQGVATSWLKHKHPTNGHRPTVPVYVRKSQFRLPFKPSVPIIMVGPGTGIAPFRGFIQERDYHKREGKEVGSTVLYTGCRNKAIDYIYEDELTGYSKAGSLTELNVAFSRDSDEKVYVQHLMKKHASEIWKVMKEQQGHLYVCGDAKLMANDVQNLLFEICEREGGMARGDAEKYVKMLETKGRYSKDVWS